MAQKSVDLVDGRLKGRGHVREQRGLASISFVPFSFKQPELTSQVAALGVVRMLEAMRIVNPKIRFYQASSSEMFGRVQESPQNELTLSFVRSPFVAGRWKPMGNERCCRVDLDGGRAF